MKIDPGNFARIIDRINDGLYFVDRKRRITLWNRAAERMTGFSPEEVMGRACSDNILMHVDEMGNSLCKGMCPLAETILDGRTRTAMVFLHHKEGHRIPVDVRTGVLTNENGDVIGGVELFADVSRGPQDAERIRELERLAMLDPLTQLANRNYILKELRSRFDEKKRFGLPFGILFMDVDHFKEFNDTYGHALGDRVLAFIARTLSANSRSFDLYGRWGGEEFIGIIRNIEEKELAGLGDRIRMLVEKAFLEHGGKKLRVTLSIGATMATDDDTADTLLERADRMMYEGKSAGRNRLILG